MTSEGLFYQAKNFLPEDLWIIKEGMKGRVKLLVKFTELGKMQGTISIGKLLLWKNAMQTCLDLISVLVSTYCLNKFPNMSYSALATFW